MMTRIRSAFLRRLLVFSLTLPFCLGLYPASALEDVPFEHNRARLVGFILRQHLETQHFTHKKVDDSLSKAAFGVFLKQLDFQKRFLLKADVEGLKKYASLIDDELTTGKMDLAVAGADVLIKRVEQVQRMVREILSGDFDFTEKDFIETDAEKLDYCLTQDELKERWRKTLKFQVLQQYLNLMEDEASAEASEKKKQTPSEMKEAASAKILKSYEGIFSRTLHEKEREHFDRYFSAVTSAFDPHTDYMPPTDKEDFDISMRGSLEGIGATLREEGGYIKVQGLVPGGPAFRQGQLHAEDVILKVAEGRNEPVDITDMSVKDAVRLIRGRKGTEVRLRVKKPDGSQVVIPIIRDVVQLEDSFVKATTVKDEKSGRTFGYIKVPAFYRDFEKTRNGGDGRNSTDDVRRELQKFASEKISGLIIDLRNNGGGALTDAVRTTGLFIKTGPVVQVKGSDGKISVLSDDDPEISYTGPVLVLVNKFSASASEILAGALQDYGRAVVLGGEHTHGKGTVQSIIDLNDSLPFQNMDQYKPLGALKLTTQKFYRVTGESTQYRGITSDIVLPDPMNSLKSGEQNLDFALPWDTVNAAPYTRWTNPVADIPALRAKSGRRVFSKQDFVDIQAESDRIMEQQKKTTQSLNIDAARKEREENRSKKEKGGKKAHDPSHPEKKQPDEQMSSEEKRQLWLKEVTGDAYVQEGVSVLTDMISAPSAASLN